MPQGETLTNLYADLQLRYGDVSKRKLTDARALRFINDAERYVARKTNYARHLYPLSATARDPRIVLPADTLKLYHIFYLPGNNRLLPLQQDERGFTEYITSATGGTPRFYSLNEENELLLYPSPSAGSETAAVNDGSNIAAGDTTITYDGASGTLETDGFVQINSEIVMHNGSSTTQLKNCKRGWAGTTAAAHNDDAVITELDYVVGRSYIPAVATASVNSSVPKEWTEAIISHAMWKLMRMDRHEGVADRYAAETTKIISEMKNQYDQRLEMANRKITAGASAWWATLGYPGIGNFSI